MGSWNGTCGISQLPITAGTKVKAFLMLQSEYAHGIGGSSSCYSTTYFRPWFFPLTAEYNDYGSIQTIEPDWNAKYMLETFQQWLASGEVRILGRGECEINDPGVKEFKTLENVFDCVERGALVFKNPGERFDKEKQEWVPAGGYLKIGIFMILDTVYQGVIAEAIRFLKLPANEFYQKRDKEDLQKALESITKHRGKNVVKSDNPELDEALLTMRDIYVDRFLGDLIEEHCAFKHYKTILFSPDGAGVEDFFARIDEVRKLSTAMSYLRKSWFPPCGSGSQSEELSFNAALSGAVAAHIKNREDEMEKYRKEDEEWDRKYKAEQKAKKAEKKPLTSKKKPV